MPKKIGNVGKNRDRKSARPHRLAGLGFMLPAASGLMMAATPAAHALQLYDGSASGNNIIVNLNITTDYSGFYRVQSPSKVILSNANGNDGDANFRHGVVGNAFEVLPVLDIKDGNFGMHFSGEYFINTVYLGTNQNNQPATVNPILAKNTDFASETRQADGNNGRMLDAFVYNSWHTGQQTYTLKVGQQTLFWGTAIFSTDAISGGQAPIDSVAAESLADPQLQQIYLPVGQVVATWQPNQIFTLQAYYQYQWEPYSLPGVGSFLSGNDNVGPGGQRIIIPTLPLPGFSPYLLQTKALTPVSQNGQFGASIQASYGNYDVGLFGLRFDAKVPVVATTINLAPSGLPSPFPAEAPNGGTYRQIFPRDIWLAGTSLATTVGATQVSAEVSARVHNPLDGQPAATFTFDGFPLGANNTNANSNPSYPVGDSLAAIFDAIYGSPALSFDPGGVTVLGEIVYLKLLSVTANKQLLAPGRSSSAAALNVNIIPAYYDVLPSLTVDLPVSLSYNFAGNSEVDGSINHGTGSWTAGVSLIYKTVWNASLTYNGAFGSPNVSTTVDRGYLLLGLSRTF